MTTINPTFTDKYRDVIVDLMNGAITLPSLSIDGNLTVDGSVDGSSSSGLNLYTGATKKVALTHDGTNSIYSYDGNLLFKNSNITRFNVSSDGTYIKIGSGDVGIYIGSVSPEGAVSAPVGAVYLKTNGTYGTSIYIKESAVTGTTGWSGLFTTNSKLVSPGCTATEVFRQVPGPYTVSLIVPLTTFTTPNVNSTGSCVRSLFFWSIGGYGAGTGDRSYTFLIKRGPDLVATHDLRYHFSQANIQQQWSAQFLELLESNTTYAIYLSASSIVSTATDYLYLMVNYQGNT